MHDRREALAGGLYGLLVGDALGVPYEFARPEVIAASGPIDMIPPAAFVRSHRNVAPGTWSDDGAQALCLLASLLERGRLDVGDVARRFVAWLDEGHLAVDAHVFDVGIQTSLALRAIMGGADPASAGSTEERHNGNGSLMRVLPLALWHRGSDAALVADAIAQSRITHGHPLSLACCALYCLWARCELEGEGRAAWTRAVERFRATDPDAALLLALEMIRPDEPARGGGAGFVVDTLASARMVVAGDSYEDIVRAAVALGHDTDTTACVAGGIAGIRAGVRGIPQRWLSLLRGKEMVEPMLDALVAHHATPA